MTNNPYQAPAADVADQANNRPYQPKILSVHGRIGRLRYLAYGFLSLLVMIPVFAIFGAFVGMGGSNDSGAMSGLALVVVGLIYLGLLVYSFILAKRRFNDLDMTGWLGLLLLVPLVGFVVALILVFAPGKKMGNKYGPPPVKNNTWVILGALIVPIAVIGILAAVAIPAYQDYVERAQQYESSSNFE